MSSSHLTQKIGEIYQISKKLANSDELGAVRVTYLEMKDKYEKKKAKSVGKVKSGTGTSLLDDSEELDAIDQMDDPADGAVEDEGLIGSESMDSDDSDNEEGDDDDEEEPPFPPSTRSKRSGSMFERQDSREKNESDDDSGSDMVDSDGNPTGGISQQKTPTSASSRDLNAGNTNNNLGGGGGKGEAANAVIQTGGRSGRSNKSPVHPRVRNIMGPGPGNVDTDDIGGGRSETEEVGRKMNYYDQTDREDSATERETDKDNGSVANKRGSQRKPPVLKIVAGGFDARAARRRGGDRGGNGEQQQQSRTASSSSLQNSKSGSGTKKTNDDDDGGESSVSSSSAEPKRADAVPADDSPAGASSFF
jgi:hypothetical protein